MGEIKAKVQEQAEKIKAWNRKPFSSGALFVLLMIFVAVFFS